MASPSIDNVDFFIDLPPLPAGWDWQRYKSLQPGELSALPEPEQSLIRAHQKERFVQWHFIRGAIEVAESRLAQLQLRRTGLFVTKPGTAETSPPEAENGDPDHLTREERAVVEHYGLPVEQVGSPLFEIAEVMHRRDCKYWGFMAFRVWGYGSAVEQTRVREFNERLGQMINEKLSRLAVEGIKNTGLQDEDEGFEARFKGMYDAAMPGGILPLWQLIMRDGEALGGLGPQEVREIFRVMLKLDEEEDESLPNRVPVGVDAGVCLMVDEGVVNSMLDEREGNTPYVIGVLSDIDDPDVAENAEALHFKIAMDSVVDFWRQIQVQDVTTLLPPEGKVYISPGIFRGR